MTEPPWLVATPNHAALLSWSASNLPSGHGLPWAAGSWPRPWQNDRGRQRPDRL